MDIDEALGLVGGYRRWHLMIFVLLGMSQFMPICWQGLIIVFAGWEPPHRCRLNDDDDVIGLFQVNASSSLTTEFSQSMRCSAFSENFTSYTAHLDKNITSRSQPSGECTNGWVFDNGGYYTIVEQWQLVCERNYLSEVSQTTFQVGYILSLIFLSFPVDAFGRKNVHTVTHILIAIVGVAIAFSTNYVTFVILRVVMGILIVTNINSGTTLLLELFDSKRRAFAGIGLEASWIACYLILPIFAYYITDWRHLQILISASSAIWIVYVWILPESPQWLEAMGRYREAEKVLEDMARWNGVNVVPGTLRLRRPPHDGVEKSGVSGKTDGCDRQNINVAEVTDYKSFMKTAVTDFKPLAECRNSCATSDGNEAIQMGSISDSKLILTDNDTVVNSDNNKNSHKDFKRTPLLVELKSLFRNARMRHVIAVSSALWFANCMVYYGLILSTPSLAGDRFLNFFVMGLVEIPAFLLSLYTSQRFGRRISTSVYHVIAGVFLAVVVFVPPRSSSGADLSWVIVALVMLSKFAISASFSVIILYTRELVPTSVRSTGCGAGQLLGVVGNIFAPFAGYAAKSDLFWLPNFLFGVVSIVVGLLTLTLPETLGWALPQTMEDLEKMFDGKGDEGRLTGFCRWKGEGRVGDATVGGRGASVEVKVEDNGGAEWTVEGVEKPTVLEKSYM